MDYKFRLNKGNIWFNADSLLMFLPDTRRSWYSSNDFSKPATRLKRIKSGINAFRLPRTLRGPFDIWGRAQTVDGEKSMSTSLIHGCYVCLV